MKRYISWILVILLTFTFGVITTLLLFSHNSQIPSCSNETSNENLFESLPVLNYCELRNNPDKYDGKIVRLNTDILSGNHGEYIYDVNCPADEKIKDYYAATAAFMYIDRREQKKVTDIRIARSAKPWTDPVNVVTVGKFRKNEFTRNDSGMDRNAEFHFMVISLEIVSDKNKK